MEAQENGLDISSSIIKHPAASAVSGIAGVERPGRARAATSMPLHPRARRLAAGQVAGGQADAMELDCSMAQLSKLIALQHQQLMAQRQGTNQSDQVK